MDKITELETNRLKLRQWLLKDQAPFAILNADPKVMEFYPNTLKEAQSNSFAQKLSSLISNNGWGLWAVESKADNNFIGYVGLHKPQEDLPFSPCVEIGWRLSRHYWGKGYAIEAADATLKFAFDILQLNEVVSFTSVLNTKSLAVMKKLNMVDEKQNFEHPNIPIDHKLRKHVLYKISKEQWSSNRL